MAHCKMTPAAHAKAAWLWLTAGSRLAAGLGLRFPISIQGCENQTSLHACWAKRATVFQIKLPSCSPCSSSRFRSAFIMRVCCPSGAGKVFAARMLPALLSCTALHLVVTVQIKCVASDDHV